MNIKDMKYSNTLSERIDTMEETAWRNPASSSIVHKQGGSGKTIYDSHC